RDSLGRITGRLLNNVADATWTFDTGRKGLLDHMRILHASGTTVFQREFSYDAQARLTRTVAGFDGKTYTLKQAYTSWGQIAGYEYPNKEAIEFLYTTSGYLKKEQNPLISYARPVVYREVLGMSPRGQVTLEKYGNNLYGKFDYFASTGQVKKICVGEDSNCIRARQNLSYEYKDPYSNLTAQIKDFDPVLGQTVTRVKEAYS